MFRRLQAMCLLFIVNGIAFAQQTDLLGSIEQLELVNVTAQVVEFQGKSAVNLRGILPSSGGLAPQAGTALRSDRPESLAIVKGFDFGDGTIEVELAGRPAEGVRDAARGFVGIAFHVDPTSPIAYDCFYVRPTNGRAEDQLRRNHTCQYMSHPDYPFHRLREEHPGVYESYADLVPGEWTQLKIVVAGTKARLFVNGADQPSLIVNDLKRANQPGRIALWLEQSTDAYFRNLRVTVARGNG